MSSSITQPVDIGNRIEIGSDTANALLSVRAHVPLPDLDGGLLRAEVRQSYQALDVPGLDRLRSVAGRFLTGSDSDGFLVVGCAAVLETAGDPDIALDLLTIVLTALGTPLRVFDNWELWKPITSRLDVEPMRAFGIGHNPLHLDLVNAINPPDISGLLCLQPDPLGEGFSLVSQVRPAVDRLASETRRLLAEPVFTDGAFYDVSGIGGEYRPFPILDGLPPEEGFVRFTAKMLGDRDPEDPATQAARALERELVAGQQRFRLERGDLLLINQHLNCHGREPLGHGQEQIPEGSRRLLRQVFIRTSPNTTAGR